MTSTNPPHEYIPAFGGHGRSPCPALNALANHGYLPRDGKNITVPQLVKALTSVYNLSYPLAFAFATMGVMLCGHGLTLDLERLRKHNVIEHDASIVHCDLDETGGSRPSNRPDYELIQAIIDLSNGNKVTLENLIRHKYNRELRAGAQQKKMGPFLNLLSHGEPVLCQHALSGSDMAIPVEWFRTWMGEERLPEGLTPPRTLGVIGLHRKTRKVSNQLNMLHIKGAKDRRDAQKLL